MRHNIYLFFVGVLVISLILVAAIILSYFQDDHILFYVMAFFALVVYLLVVYVLVRNKPSKPEFSGTYNILHSAKTHNMLDEILYEFSKANVESVADVEHKVLDSYFEWIK